MAERCGGSPACIFAIAARPQLHCCSLRQVADVEGEAPRLAVGDAIESPRAIGSDCSAASSAPRGWRRISPANLFGVSIAIEIFAQRLLVRTGSLRRRRVAGFDRRWLHSAVRDFRSLFGSFLHANASEGGEIRVG